MSQNKPRRKAEFGPLGLVVVNLGLVLHLLSQDSDLVVAQALNRAPVLDGILSDEDVRHLERVLPVVVVVVMKAAAPLVSFKGVVVVVDVVVVLVVVVDVVVVVVLVVVVVVVVVVVLVVEVLVVEVLVVVVVVVVVVFALKYKY